MTDEQAAGLAKSCVTALLTNDLEGVAFTDILRRGLQKWLDKIDGHFITPDDVDWQTLSLVKRSRFPGFEAFLFHLECKAELREVFVGVDEANRIRSLLSIESIAVVAEFNVLCLMILMSL